MSAAQTSVVACSDNVLQVNEAYDYNIEYTKISGLSWNIFKHQWGKFILVLFLQMAIGWLAVLLSAGPGLIGLLIAYFVEMIVSSLTQCVTAGFIYVGIKYMRGYRTFTWGDFFAGFTWTVFKAYILCYIFTTLGFICFIFPGIYLLVALIFVTPIAVDRPNLPIMTMIKLSIRMVNKHWCGTFALLLWIVVIVLVGLLCLGLGVLPAAVVVQIMAAVFYRDAFGLDANGQNGSEATITLGPGHVDATQTAVQLSNP